MRWTCEKCGGWFEREAERSLLGQKLCFGCDTARLAELGRVAEREHVEGAQKDAVARVGLAGHKALLLEAKAIVEQVEWIEDNGRECAWCSATRHTFNRAEVIGTPAERKPRDNHRETCRWLTFIKGVEAL